MAFKALHYLVLAYLPRLIISHSLPPMLCSKKTLPLVVHFNHTYLLSYSCILYYLLPSANSYHPSRLSLVYHTYSKKSSLNSVRLNTFLCALHIPCTFWTHSHRRIEICLLHRLQWNLKGRDHLISIFETHIVWHSKSAQKGWQEHLGNVQKTHINLVLNDQRFNL